MSDENVAKNTDREIWRREEGDFYSPSMHVTERGEIGIDVKGFVIVAPAEKWHDAMRRCISADEYGHELRSSQSSFQAKSNLKLKEKRKW
jgi:hypothetical protein